MVKQIKYLSYSALSTYQECPLKFKFEYIDRLGDIYRQDRPYFSFGGSLHTALAKFFQIKDVQQRTLDLLYTLLKKSWISKGYSTVEEETEYRQKAISLLQHFYETADISAQPLYIEEFFRIPIEDFFLSGKIDRIDAISGDKVEVIDYKTGKTVVTQKDLQEDLQLGIYALAVVKKLQLKPQRVTILSLEQNMTFSTEINQERIERTEQEVIKIYRNISEDREFAPKETGLCPYCDYSVICPIMGLGVKPAEKEKFKEDYQATIKYLESIRNDLYALHKASLDVSSILDTNALIKKSLRSIMDLSKVDKGVFITFDDEEKFKVIFSVGTPYVHAQGEVVLPHSREEIAKLLKVKSEIIPTAVVVNDAPKKPEYLKLISDDPEVRHMILLSLVAKERLLGLIVLANHKDGSVFDNYDVSLLQSLALQVAISLYNAKLYELAITDGLTKLFIHRYFQQRLDQELSRAKRYRSNLSLLMMDIDHFKNVNDTYGHLEGDTVLRSLANLFKSKLRDTDVVARYGGEEFACILVETGSAGAKETAERLRRAVENHVYTIKNVRVPITISIGVTTYDFNISKEEFIEQADRALYKAKQAGRNRVMVYDEDSW
ncbi:MAG: diguanylate cyclase [Elusimicrobiota bacterium]|nr:diguanylate cyclase [Elusimicrobiota bacterium]